MFCMSNGTEHIILNHHPTMYLDKYMLPLNLEQLFTSLYYMYHSYLFQN